jgi:hypothetical protein
MSSRRRRRRSWHCPLIRSREDQRDNPNMELDDKDPRWLDYTFLTSEEITDE